MHGQTWKQSLTRETSQSQILPVCSLATRNPTLSFRLIAWAWRSGPPLYAITTISCSHDLWSWLTPKHTHMGLQQSIGLSTELFSAFAITVLDDDPFPRSMVTVLDFWDAWIYSRVVCSCILSVRWLSLPPALISLFFFSKPLPTLIKSLCPLWVIMFLMGI